MFRPRRPRREDSKDNRKIRKILKDNRRLACLADRRVARPGVPSVLRVARLRFPLLPRAVVVVHARALKTVSSHYLLSASKTTCCMTQHVKKKPSDSGWAHHVPPKTADFGNKETALQENRTLGADSGLAVSSPQCQDSRPVVSSASLVTAVARGGSVRACAPPRSRSAC